MTTFVFTDVNKTVRVELLTDLRPGSTSDFTIMDIRELSTVEASLGIPSKRVVSSIQSLVDVAVANDLKLERFDQGAEGAVTVQDFTGIYYNGGIGIDNL